MMKMNKKAVAAITVLMMLALCLTGCGGGDANKDAGNDAQQSAATTNLVFASGGTSGTYYPVAGAIAQVWENNVEGVSVNVQATGASAEKPEPGKPGRC